MNALSDVLLLKVLLGNAGLLAWIGVNLAIGITLVTLGRICGWRWVRRREDDV